MRIYLNLIIVALTVLASAHARASEPNPIGFCERYFSGGSLQSIWISAARDLRDGRVQSAANLVLRLDKESTARVRALTDHQLSEEAQAIISDYIDRRGYLPGLTHDWNARSIGELVSDFSRNEIGQTKLYNFYANLKTPVDWLRAKAASIELLPRDWSRWFKLLAASVVFEEFYERVASGKLQL